MKNLFNYSNSSITVLTDKMVDIDKNNLIDLIKSDRLIRWTFDGMYEAILKIGMRPIYRLKYYFGGFQLEFVTVVAKNPDSGVKSEFILYKDDEGNLRLGYNCTVESQSDQTGLEMIYNMLISNNIISDTPIGSPLKYGVTMGPLK